MVSGHLGGYLAGGHTWAFLNYAIGIKRLGYDVFFYVELDHLQGSLDKKMTAMNTFKYIDALGKQFGFKYVMNFKNKLFGIKESGLNKILRNTELLISLDFPAA